jgi:hypothetical protein
VAATLKQKQARANRVRKRLAIRFGAKDTHTGTGFTTNISARGVGVVTHAVHPRGTKLNMELTLPGGDRCRVECVVAWAQRGVAQFRTPGGMGLRVTWADENYFQFIAHVMGTEFLPDSETSRPAAASSLAGLFTPERSRPTIPSSVIEAAPPAEAGPASTAVRERTTPPMPVETRGVVAPAVSLADLREVIPDVPPAGDEVDARSNPEELTAEHENWFQSPDDNVGESSLSVPVVEPVPLTERAPRLEEQLPVRFGVGEELTGRGYTLNLSRTGLALLTTSSLKPHEQVNIAISTPDGMFSSGTATVVWARPQTFGTGHHVIVGVRLNNVDVSYDELLDVLARA